MVTRHRDTLRTIWNTKSRFLAIVIMTALAAFVYVGISETPHLMRDSLEAQIETAQMEHLRISSPLGLYPEDRTILSDLKNVKKLRYLYSGDYFFGDNDIMRIYSMADGINLPALREGRFPANEREIVLDALAQKDGRFKVGDTITFYKKEDASDQTKTKPDETAHSGKRTDDDAVAPIHVDSPAPLDEVGQLKTLTYTVTGFAEDIHYLRPERDITTIGDGKTDYFALVLPDAFRAETRPSSALLTFSDLEGAETFLDSYRMNEMQKVDEIRPLLDGRSTALEQEIKADANRAIQEGEEKVTDGRKKLNDAKKKLDDAKKKLDDGENSLKEGEAKLRRETEDAQKKLDKAKRALDESKATLNEKEAAYNDGLKKQKSGEAELEAAQQQIDQALQQIEQGFTEIKTGIDKIQNELDQLPSVESPEIAAIRDELEAKKNGLAAQAAELEAKRAGLQPKIDELKAARAKLEQGRAELAAGRAQLDDGWAQYNVGREEWQTGLNTLESKKAEGEAKLRKAREDLEKGRADYAEGKATYDKNKKDADPKLRDAEKQLRDARRKAQDIRVPSYTLQGRYDNYAIFSFFDQANSLATLSFIFPTIFYLVAMLVSLTTTMRMVQEERAQIGTLKALGYTKKTIASKYIIYAASSSSMGALLGGVLGWFVLTPTIFNAYATLITIQPASNFSVRFAYFIIAIALSMAVVLFSTWFAVSRALHEKAVDLMRPKPPANGHRILLERLSFVWQHLSFTRKITMRNLTAKKSRMFMTILGIAGCTGLITMGFGIRDSVNSLIEKQFTQIQTYDLKVVFNPDAAEVDLEKLKETLQSKNATIAMATNETGTFKNTEGFSESFELYVPIDISTFRSMIALRDRVSGTAQNIPEGGALASEKMVEALGLGGAGKANLRDVDGFSYQVPINGHVENYVRHVLFLSPPLYEKTFGEAPRPNVILAKMSDAENAASRLLELDAVTTVIPMRDVTNIVDGLTDSLRLVVFVIIAISSTLALVVLFNLTNLNVSERLRELSTIKVLGFRSIEVTEYIYRETFLLTIVGIFFGFFAGKAAHFIITGSLAPSDVMLDPVLNPTAFLLAGGLTLLFSLLIMLYIHVHLKKVDMVEALKAVE